MLSRLHDVENGLRQTFRHLVLKANIECFVYGSELSLPFHVVWAHTSGMNWPGCPQ